ncbi:MAG: cytochrome c [Chloroflexi bacterium]|nr:cytochrome c [Chloroflexota bacterium]
MQRSLQITALAFLGMIIFIATGILFGESPAHALPEYAERTDESCAVCHVNPGGGGPRTLRGILWSAQGKPDLVPDLGNVLVAQGVEDGDELFDIACAGCHGAFGEGLFGNAIALSGVQESKIESTILRGRERSGMPAFDGRFTDDQLEAIVAFVTGIASGEIEPQPLSFPLPPVELDCVPGDAPSDCGGN